MYKINNVQQGTNIVNEDRYARLKSEMSSRGVNVQSRLCATGRLSAWTLIVCTASPAAAVNFLPPAAQCYSSSRLPTSTVAVSGCTQTKACW